MFGITNSAKLTVTHGWDLLNCIQQLHADRLQNSLQSVLTVCMGILYVAQLKSLLKM